MKALKNQETGIAEAQQAKMQDLVSELLVEARRQGATAAEAGVSSDIGLAVTVRMGEVETIEHTRDNALGITVYIGHRKGSASTSDLGPQALKDTVSAACQIARHTTEDECAGLADAERMANELPDLDLYHPWIIDVEEAIALATECESAARALDERIVNSEGASVNTQNGIQVYGNSHGFLAGNRGTRHSLSCAVVGRDAESMQRDYWYSASRAPQQLESAASVGEQAAKRTVARLGSRRLNTRKVPVTFRAEVAAGLLRSFVSAVRGASLYRRASFLLDQLGQPIFPGFARIYEEPRLLRGLASSAYDSEGVATCARDLVSGGILQGYVLDSYSARKLGMETTGNAGGVRNLRIASGDLDLPALLREMDTGLLVTEVMGQGVNTVTGDYSRGAAGFWVEQGEIRYPVEEITIAGNLKAMFRQLLAVGNDVDRRSSIQTGSWLIEQMMVAGD